MKNTVELKLGELPGVKHDLEWTGGFTRVQEPCFPNGSRVVKVKIGPQLGYFYFVEWEGWRIAGEGSPFPHNEL